MDNRKYDEMYNTLAKELFSWEDVIEFAFETVKRIVVNTAKGTQ